MNSRLHFHSDAAFFAGSENMLVNFFSSDTLRLSHTPSLTYRWSVEYEQGLQRRMASCALAEGQVNALHLADPAWLHQQTVGWPVVLRGMVRALSGLLLFKYWMVLWNTIALWRHFRTIRPAIVHVNNGGYPGALSCLAAAIAGRLCGARAIVMVVNNFAIPYQGLRRWLDYPLDRLVTACVTRYVTGSHAAAERLREVLKLPHGKVASLHNGIARRVASESREAARLRLGVGAGQTCFGVVALLESRKGHRILVDAIARLSAAHPAQTNQQADFDQLLVLFEGDGPEREAIAEQVRAARLDGRVQLVGVEDNVVSFMQAIDVLVLPSTGYEDFPNVILEAMSLGKPVIASRLAGIPEQVEDGASGLLCAPGDAAALATALLRLLREPDTRQAFGVCGRERFDARFSAQAAVARYLDLYNELLKEDRA